MIATTASIAPAPEPGTASDLDAMLAAKVAAMKNLQAEAQKAQQFLTQCEQEALRLDGQMRLLVEMGGRHPEIVPPAPVSQEPAPPPADELPQDDPTP